jgi:1-acyl-sn-glycerol-3-phosphate acyltransferase
MSGSRQSGAEVIALDHLRRQRAGATRPRCQEVTAAGRPCRNYAGPNGYCRVHDPDPHRTEAADEELHAPAAEPREFEATVEAVLSFLRRRLTGDYHVDVFGFDRELTELLLMPLARPLYSKWWRVSATGLEHVPAEGGALVVANHSGTLPFDAIMTKLALLDEHPAHRHLRELAADLALQVPVIGPLARKTGNTLAHDDDALRLLSAGELVGVWPEGFKGIGKLYRDRYKLQRFGRGGFVEVALRAQVPIIPVATIGAEEIYPMVANLRLLARLLGLPYFPVTPFFPLLGPLGAIPLPTKWSIEFGEPIRTDLIDPADADPMTVLNVTDRAREAVQQKLYERLRERDGVFTG